MAAEKGPQLAPNAESEARIFSSPACTLHRFSPRNRLFRPERVRPTYKRRGAQDSPFPKEMAVCGQDQASKSIGSLYRPPIFSEDLRGFQAGSKEAHNPPKEASQGPSAPKHTLFRRFSLFP